jgi:hypothetical protein
MLTWSCHSLRLIICFLPLPCSYPALSTVPNGAKWEGLNAEEADDSSQAQPNPLHPILTPFSFVSWFSDFIMFVSCLICPVIIGVDSI